MTECPRWHVDPVNLSSCDVCVSCSGYQPSRRTERQGTVGRYGNAFDLEG
jgi:hypothetical protein